MIKIRLARAGRPHNPIYSVLAIDSRKAQNGTCLENLGTYNPAAEEPLKGLKVERVAHWVRMVLFLLAPFSLFSKKQRSTLSNLSFSF